MPSIRTKAADYQTIIEAVGYAKRIISIKEQSIIDNVKRLSTEEYMAGETGKEFADQLQAIAGVAAAVNVKMDKLINSISEKSDQNRAWLNNSMAAGFEDANKGFKQLSELIKDTTINGKPKS